MNTEKENRRNALPLVRREDIIKKTKLDNSVENLREIEYLENKKIREDNRKMRVQRSMTNKIIALSAAGAVAVALFGTSLGVNATINDVKTEEEYMAQPLHEEELYEDTTEYDMANPYSQDNLVFDHTIQEVDGITTYRVVVNKQGDCAFVTMDYQSPFQSLNGVSPEEAAENFGFDFNSLSNGRSR